MNYIVSTTMSAFLFSSLFWTNYAATFSGLTIALLATTGVLLMSVVLGVWWYMELVSGFSNKLGVLEYYDAIESILKSKCNWMQAVRPQVRPLKFNYTPDKKSFIEIIKKRFFLSHLFGIGVLCLGYIFLLTVDGHLSDRGLFGSILKSPIGKGITLSFGIYASVSSLAFLVVGLIAFISQRFTK